MDEYTLEELIEKLRKVQKDGEGELSLCKGLLCVALEIEKINSSLQKQGKIIQCPECGTILLKGRLVDVFGNGCKIGCIHCEKSWLLRDGNLEKAEKDDQ